MVCLSFCIFVSSPLVSRQELDDFGLFAVTASAIILFVNLAIIILYSQPCCEVTRYLDGHQLDSQADAGELNTFASHDRMLVSLGYEYPETIEEEEVL